MMMMATSQLEAKAQLGCIESIHELKLAFHRRRDDEGLRRLAWWLHEQGKPLSVRMGKYAVACGNGFHLTMLEQSPTVRRQLICPLQVDMLCSPHIFLRFAIDCAERVLHVYESALPHDTRINDVLVTSRAYLARRSPRWYLKQVSGTAYAAAKTADAIFAHTDHTVAHAAYAAVEAAEAASYSANVRVGTLRASIHASQAADDRGRERAWQSKRFLQYMLGQVHEPITTGATSGRT